MKKAKTVPKHPWENTVPKGYPVGMGMRGNCVSVMWMVRTTLSLIPSLIR